jgi:itaconate CoA-transferase
VIDISMFESAVAWLGYFPHHYWHKGEEPARVGMRHHYIVPYGPYLAGDGVYVSLAVATPQDWEVFCRKVIQRPDLLEDPRFKTSPDRRKNRAVLEEMVEKMFLEQSHEEWLRRLREAELPHGKLNGIGEVLAHPQVMARKMIREMESPGGPVPVVGSPLRLSESPARFDPIPALGEDTEPILRELGYRDAEIQKLRQDHVI